jgi:4'-phosphopantetheinyl transferase
LHTDPLIDWLPAVAQPPLAAQDIHVWRLAQELPPGGSEQWLDAGERARLERAAEPGVRRRLLATRLALRQVLAGYVGCTPGDLQLSVADGGKPFLANGPCFNLSHSGDLALLAVGQVPLGIDVERLREIREWPRIARRVLDPALVEQLLTLPADAQASAFLAAWTAMEARQKSQGEGVFGRRVAPQEVGELAFRPDPQHLARLAWAGDLGTPTLHWYAQVVPAAADDPP